MLNYNKLVQSLKYSKIIFLSFLGLYGRAIKAYKTKRKHDQVFRYFKKNFGCDYKYLIDYYMFIGHCHLEFKPHYGAFIKHSHRLLDIYPRILALDSNQESLDCLENTIEGSFCPLELFRYRKIDNQLLDSLSNFDSISLPFVFDEIEGDEEVLEDFILRLKSLLNEGGVIAGFSTSGLGFNHNKKTQNHIILQNNEKKWFNLNRDITNLESILSKHFTDVSSEIVGSCFIFRASLARKKVDTLPHKLKISEVEGKYLYL